MDIWGGNKLTQIRRPQRQKVEEEEPNVASSQEHNRSTILRIFLLALDLPEIPFSPNANFLIFYIPITHLSATLPVNLQFPC